MEVQLQKQSNRLISTMAFTENVSARFGSVWFGLPYTILDHSQVSFGFG
jgi:hypothetical protein